MLFNKALQAFVWIVGRGQRSRPPQWNRIAVRNRSRFRKPQALIFSHWILALRLSEAAAVEASCFQCFGFTIRKGYGQSVAVSGAGPHLPCSYERTFSLET